jgi:hypothetical protein
MKLGLADSCVLTQDYDFDDDPAHGRRPLILAPYSTPLIPVEWDLPPDSLKPHRRRLPALT